MITMQAFYSRFMNGGSDHPYLAIARSDLREFYLDDFTVWEMW